MDGGCGCSEPMDGGKAKKNDTKKFWYEKAKLMKIPGRSKMSKDELKKAVSGSKSKTKKS